MQIIIRAQHTAVTEPSGRTAACGIAQLIHHLARINKIIDIPDLPDGGRLEERVVRKIRAISIAHARSDEDRSFHDCQHIRSQNRTHRPMSCFVMKTAEPRIQISPVTFCQYARIELRLVALPTPQLRTIRIMHIAIELKLSRGRIGDRHGNDIKMIQHIVQIISSIRSLCDIRRIETRGAVSVQGILRLLIDDALIAPVSEIVLRRRPSHIISGAVNAAAEPVMRPIYINPSVVNMRFPVRYIFPGWKIWIYREHFVSVFHQPFSSFVLLVSVSTKTLYGAAS